MTTGTGRAPGSRRPGPGGRGTGLSTVALASVTVAAGIGMARLYRGTEFLGPVLIAAVAAHVGAWSSRRLRIPALPSLLLGLLLIFLVALWLVMPATTWWGLPTPATFHAVGSELARARTDFSLLRAPVPATTGFLLVSCLGVGIIGAAADWAAFRLRGGIECLIPSFALFVFTAALGAGGGRALAGGAYAATALAFVLAHHTARRLAETRWLGGLDGAGRMALLGGGAALASVAVLAGFVAGPLLPGAKDPGAISWHNRRTPSVTGRTTISPLVDIRATLSDQSRTELFTVKSILPAYWRLTALDHFDGNVWSSDERYDPIEGVSIPSPGRRQELLQRVTIRNLSEAWLPAAYRPVAVKLPDAAFNSSSSSLITTTDTTAGLSYDVTSAVPSESADALASVATDQLRSGLDAATMAQMRQLPSGISSSIVALANRVVTGESTPYGKALALQQYLRSAPFSYNVHVPAGHDSDALVNFLFHTHQGFCEQFAGAYAVMARVVGLPTRVAVGFTPGELRHGVYHVYGADAHAWPEVWLGASHGWVAFEPTPGRGQPGAEAWTGVTAAQARVPALGGTTATPATGPTPTPATARTGDLLARGLSSLADTGGGTVRREQGLAGSPVLPTLLVVGSLGALWVGGVPAARALRRRRRRAGSAGPARILVAWSEVEEALDQAKLGRRPSETFEEYARRVGSDLGPAARRTDLHRLAIAAGTAAYALHMPDHAVVRDAVATAQKVERSLRAGVPVHRRWWWTLDARPLLGKRRSKPSGYPPAAQRIRASHEGARPGSAARTDGQGVSPRA